MYPATLPTDQYPEPLEPRDQLPTYAAIAREMGITAPAVYRLEKKALKKIFGLARCEQCWEDYRVMVREMMASLGNGGSHAL